MIPKYPYKPISNIHSLALHLNVTEAFLAEMAARIPNMTRRAEKLKKDGSIRVTFDAHEPLKSLHHLIATRILKRVIYPSYLHGSLPKRDIVSNALPHAKAHTLILDDIKNFYPSISTENIKRMWMQLFHFPDDVSELLAQLVSLNGYLPQGFRTSSFIANLILWDKEPQLVSELSSMELTYSRYVDDITISSARPLSKEQKTIIRTKVYSMLTAKGLKAKRSKSTIQCKGGQRIVTGLDVSKKRLSIEKQERKRIRAAVHELKTLGITHPASVEQIKKIRSAIGRVARLTYFKHPEAARLNAELEHYKQYLPPINNPKK